MNVTPIATVSRQQQPPVFPGHGTTTSSAPTTARRRVTVPKVRPSHPPPPPVGSNATLTDTVAKPSAMDTATIDDGCGTAYCSVPLAVMNAAQEAQLVSAGHHDPYQQHPASCVAAPLPPPTSAWSSSPQVHQHSPYAYSPVPVYDHPHQQQQPVVLGSGSFGSVAIGYLPPHLERLAPYLHHRRHHTPTVAACKTLTTNPHSRSCSKPHHIEEEITAMDRLTEAQVQAVDKKQQAGAEHVMQYYGKETVVVPPNPDTLAPEYEEHKLYLELINNDGATLYEFIKGKQRQMREVAHVIRKQAATSGGSSRRPNPKDFISESTAKRIFSQIVKGVHFCHQTGVAHRDLKPENILVVKNEDGSVANVKVIDFGMAKTWDREYPLAASLSKSTNALSHSDGSCHGCTTNPAQASNTPPSLRGGTVAKELFPPTLTSSVACVEDVDLPASMCGPIPSSLSSGDASLSEAHPAAASDYVDSEPLSSGMRGSPYYMAPELFDANSQYLATKCDVWSLGVILYMLLTVGDRPFVAEDFRRLGRKVVNLQYRRLEPSLGEASPEARDLLDRIFVYDYHQRPTLEEVLSHPWFATHN